MRPFVLVGGWPASGKSTLSESLSRHLALPHLSKDEVKEALMDALGPPRTVAASQRLGVAAVHAVLRLARSCPGAVIDSTWFEYTRPLVARLPGPCVEVSCVTDIATVRARYAARVRDPRHLDALRTEDELWGRPVPALGVGPLIEVDTTGEVDVGALAESIAVVVRR
ncbi:MULTISPECIES: AAA family ATPase [Microbacterium]|uniref:AAA family ATPase n=1 Tax=Microbacterium TaxID=33882 RepID=UPI002785C30A|nr:MULTISPECIES: AAA family ATPase [Microbacterium]MDQ1082879.1 putative kinase [Microbacterium sp. SORGH_AS_0344]MDQ1168352.1 putative kinase [Microbacterium proteolyticum]